MIWPQYWRALAARIDGLLGAAEFLTRTFSVSNSDDSTVINYSLKPALVAVIEDLKNFQSIYSHELPPSAINAIQEFLKLRVHEAITGRPIDIQKFAHLASFRSELEHLLRDEEVERRNITELAFEHLRRQLLVDQDIRKKWRDAFDKHEPACEKLGAIHLLSHGIWAFKYQALGGATDLIFPLPIEKFDKPIRRTARALVLTEWKRFKDADDLNAKAQEARVQTEIYKGGILGDVELRQTRYIVLVGELDLEALPDRIVNGITYRHIILPVEAELPSKAARRGSRARTSAIGGQRARKAV